MGVDSYAHMRLGIPITRDAFYRQTGTKRICKKHSSLQVADDVNFCSKCGDGIKTVAIETPTEGCITLAKEMDVGPVDVWMCLLDDEELCSSRPLAGSRDRVQPDLLCINLRTVGDWDDKESTSPVGKLELEVAEKKLQHLMEIFGLEGSPGLYCQLYIG